MRTCNAANHRTPVSAVRLGRARKGCAYARFRRAAMTGRLARAAAHVENAS
jgi:hypothetical protein